MYVYLARPIFDVGLTEKRFPKYVQIGILYSNTFFLTSLIFIVVNRFAKKIEKEDKWKQAEFVLKNAK